VVSIAATGAIDLIAINMLPVRCQEQLLSFFAFTINKMPFIADYDSYNACYNGKCVLFIWQVLYW